MSSHAFLALLLLLGHPLSAYALTAADCRKALSRVQQFFLDAHRQDTALHDIEKRMEKVKAPEPNATGQVRYKNLHEAIEKGGWGYSSQTARDMLGSLERKGIKNAELVTQRLYEAAATDKHSNQNNVVALIDALDPATAKALSAHPDSLAQFLHDVGSFYRFEDFKPGTLRNLLRRALLDSSGDPALGLKNTMDGIATLHREARRVAREEPALGYEAALEKAGRKIGLPDEVSKLIRQCLPLK